MEAQHLIPASDFCMHYNIEVSFLHTLQDYGLLRVTTTNEALFIDTGALSDIEKIIHLHQELDINLEGIDVILQLLKRLEEREAEVAALRNKLRWFEE
jgi:glyoxylase-like metal-dependent hydrolase (beta-lactamase superfamily II)